MVSRAPIAKITAFKKRMGWENIPWYSSFGSDFNVRFYFYFSPPRLFYPDPSSKPAPSETVSVL
jgi:predicted dithiol-disulfide oxidoreductase (DUF899 family)